MSGIKLSRVDFMKPTQVGPSMQTSASAEGSGAPVQMVFDPETRLIHLTLKSGKERLIPLENVAAMDPVPAVAKK
jgi:hypothetical protein